MLRSKPLLRWKRCWAVSRRIWWRRRRRVVRRRKSYLMYGCHLSVICHMSVFCLRVVLCCVVLHLCRAIHSLTRSWAYGVDARARARAQQTLLVYFNQKLEARTAEDMGIAIR